MKLHPKIKAAAIALAVIALGIVPTVVTGAATLKEGVVAFVLAAVPVAVGYLKSA